MSVMGVAAGVLELFLKGIDVVPSNYSLPDVLERIYDNQLALEAAIMVKEQEAREVGGNIRGALETISESTGYIKQGLVRLGRLDIG